MFKSKNVYTWAKYGFAIIIQKDSLQSKNTNTAVKKKSRGGGQQSVKKVIQTVFWDMKGPVIIDFLEKGATVNRAFYF